MSITYAFLDSRKRVVLKKEAICFSYVNNEYISFQEKPLYFAYYLPACENKKEYLEFLNTIENFPKLNIPYILKYKRYVIKISDMYSHEIFIILTVLRYLYESKKSVKFILNNKNTTEFTPLQLLLLSVEYWGMLGHTLNPYPQNMDDIKNIIYTKSNKKSNLIIDQGLYKIFGNTVSFYNRNLIKDTNLIP